MTMRHAIRRLPASRFHVCARRGRARRGRAFTLVEILVAMVVTLIMLGIVVTIFGMIGQNVSHSRSIIEMTERLRATKQRLQLDLAGITVPMLPPQDPMHGVGYFEYIEGPVGRWPAFTVSVLDETNLQTNAGPDTTVGDTDDIIMFTTQSANEPFVGRHLGAPIQSQVAEVIWFVRGTTLYRRQLLVKPDLNRTDNGRPGMPDATQVYATGQSYYALSDVSVHADGKGQAGYANLGPLPEPPGTPSDPLRLVANSLGDLTKRENRYGHVPVMGNRPGGPINNAPTYGWPFDARLFGWFVNTVTNQVTTGRLGMPTLQESSDPIFPLPIGRANAGAPIADSRYFPSQQGQLTTPSGNEAFDAWDNPNPWDQVNPLTGQLSSSGYGGGTVYGTGTRTGEDIILTNVLSFDVRVWDPTAPILLDAAGTTHFPCEPGPGYGLTTSAYGTALAAGSTTVVARGAYVDLNYGYFLTGVSSVFSGMGDARSGLNGDPTNGLQVSSGPNVYVPQNLIPAVYDTWSTHYEHDGIDQGNYIGGGFMGTDEGTNGLDDNNNGVIDDIAEQETAPPYRAPIRGLQIKIRCFDPDSKQIREVTIVQEFLPE